MIIKLFSIKDKSDDEVILEISFRTYVRFIHEYGAPIKTIEVNLKGDFYKEKYEIYKPSFSSIEESTSLATLYDKSRIGVRLELNKNIIHKGVYYNICSPYISIQTTFEEFRTIDRQLKVKMLLHN